MKSIKNLFALLLIILFPSLVFSQSATSISDMISESTSPKILPSKGMYLETRYHLYNSFHYLFNNINCKFRYGLFDVFELNGSYTYSFGHFKRGSVNLEQSSEFQAGYIENVGFKLKLYTSKSEHFEMALSGNYFFKKPPFWFGTRVPGDFDINGSVINHKIGELSFRNYLSKKIDLNYSVSINRDGFAEISAGSTLNIFKNFHACIDVYSKIAIGVPYFEGYTYLRASLNYEVVPNLLIHVATAGELGDYYGYSQSYLFGLTWKIK